MYSGRSQRHGLGQSTIAIADHDDRQHDKLDKKAIKELTRNKKRRRYESEIQSAARELSRDIVDYRTYMLMDEVSSNFELVMSTYLAHHYHHKSLQWDSALSGWVCKEAIEEGDPNQRVWYLRNAYPFEIGEHHRPVFDRTRRVTARKIVVGDMFYIVISCSCDRIYHIFGGCAHIYRALERAHVASDCFPCCYKTYDVKYGYGNVQFDASCDSITDTMRAHGGVIVAMKLQDINPSLGQIPRFGATSEEVVEWIMEGWFRIIDRNTNSLSLPITCVSVLKADRDNSDRTPYSEFHPLFSTIANRVQSAQQKQIVADHLAKAYKQVIQLETQSLEQLRSDDSKSTTFAASEYFGLSHHS